MSNRITLKSSLVALALAVTAPAFHEAQALPSGSLAAPAGATGKTMSPDVWVIVGYYPTFEKAELHMLLLQRQGKEAKVDYDGNQFLVLILQRS